MKMTKKISPDMQAFMRELIKESLRDWFKKEKWVRITTSGNIAGPCGTSKNTKNPDRCLPKAKAQSLTKAQRAATAQKKKKAGAQGKTVVKNTEKAKVTREGKFDDTTRFNLVKKNPFNIKKLVDRGVIHVTAPGDGKGGVDKPNWEGDVSIITLYNLDKAEPWMKKAITMPAPKAIPHVQDYQEDLFYNGKYNQILWSIEKKGFKPEEFYLRNRDITKEDITNLVVGMIYEMSGKEILTEKDDRCTRIAKRKYDTWPSAYASGAVVRCRRGDIWKKEK